MLTKNHYIIENSTVLVDGKFVNNTSLEIKDGYITNIGTHTSNLKRYSYPDCLVIPSFIDLQLNGCGGVLFNDDTNAVALDTMYATAIQYGCSSFLPTLISTSETHIKEAIEVAKQYYRKYPYRILGIHLEGPYISKHKKGIHDSQYIKPISQEMVRYFVQEQHNIPIKLTVAPEENNLDLIKQLIDSGVLVSIGHTNATYKQTKNAIDIGVNCATHLFNAMSPLTSRELGAVGAILNNHIDVSIIIDGQHVSYEGIELVKKIKKDKLFIVTDTVTPMGTDIQQFQLANQTIYVKNNKYVNIDGTLAGSKLDMISAVINAYKHCDIGLEEAILMASLYPARILKQEHILGQIKQSCIANLLVLNPDLSIKYVIEQGEIKRNIKN